MDSAFGGIGYTFNRETVVELYKLYREGIFTIREIAQKTKVSIGCAHDTLKKFRNLCINIDPDDNRQVKQLMKYFAVEKGGFVYGREMQNSFFPSKKWIDQKLLSYLNGESSKFAILKAYNELPLQANKKRISKTFFYDTYFGNVLKEKLTFSFYLREEDILDLAACVSSNFFKMMIIYFDVEKKKAKKSYVQIKQSALYIVNLFGGKVYLYEDLDKKIASKQMFSFKNFIEEQNKKSNKKFDVKFYDLYEKIKEQYKKSTPKDLDDRVIYNLARVKQSRLTRVI